MNRGNLARRDVLLGMGALSVVSVVPVAVAARRETTADELFAADRQPIPYHVPPTPEQRFQNAVAEMQAALEAIDPTIQSWIKVDARKYGTDCRFSLAAFTTPNVREDGLMSGRTTA